ncbi:saccharopine dehydrogenase NADP-binding domain-containing protein [Candidatus Symbiobacter mobilis]|uniref:Saccharopine dehydrogenase-like protein n=1 Tax=Candidatus Symbiobacter mobilis CR TaxID=946483 RepID=U5NAL4_9BURK|nr:saccharopine dehydrogenase NADP-binding domain-containing protein [Candidatus Symbiobacter mobilis]AGX87303.1 saccharopine dehydrogenase-like protein [Candidatus Symbiobacter mobilis CR]
MANILILGGTGHTGKWIARHLLEQSDVTVTIAGRHPEQAHAVAEEWNRQYPGQRVAGVYANTADAPSLRAAFAGHTLVVVAAPTTNHAETVVRTALETGVDYLDIQLGAKKFALLQSLATEIQRQGRCCITEAGFHPGLPSALVRYAATQLDTLDSANVCGYLQIGKDLPYTESVEELIECFKDYQGQVYRNGHWTKTDEFITRKTDFGSDIGWKNCYAMFFEELRPLPDLYPSLQETGFYISESHWVMDWILIPMIMALLKIMPHAVRPIGKLLWWGMRTFHQPPYRVELQWQASGLKDGQRATVHGTLSHPDGYVFTAIAVVAALLQYVDGSARKPGLWMMGHLVEPIRLMQDMERMGIQCRTGTQ